METPALQVARQRLNLLNSPTSEARQQLENFYKLGSFDKIDELVISRISTKNLPCLALNPNFVGTEKSRFLPIEQRVTNLASIGIDGDLLDATVTLDKKLDGSPIRGAFVMLRVGKEPISVVRDGVTTMFQSDTYCPLNKGDQVLDSSGKVVFEFQPQPTKFESKDITPSPDYKADSNLPKIATQFAISLDIGGFKELLFQIGNQKPDFMAIVMKMIVNIVKSQMKGIDGIESQFLFSGDGCKMTFTGDLQKENVAKLMEQLQNLLNELKENNSLKGLEQIIRKMVPTFTRLDARIGASFEQVTSTNPNEDPIGLKTADELQSALKDTPHPDKVCLAIGESITKLLDLPITYFDSKPTTAKDKTEEGEIKTGILSTDFENARSRLETANNLPIKNHPFDSSNLPNVSPQSLTSLEIPRNSTKKFDRKNRGQPLN